MRPHATTGQLTEANAKLLMWNEQLQNSIEDFRLSARELSAANVELARKNELLATLNDAAGRKMEELEQFYGDVESVALPTLFLDDELRIRRFTPATRQIFHLGDEDVGRSVRDFEAHFSGGDLALHASAVSQDLQPREIELSAGGRQFLARLRPHRTSKNVIVGVVATFVDISEIKRVEEVSAISRLYAVLSRVNEAIVRTREEQSLFQEVCRIVAEEGQFPLVWIGLIKGREVVPVASSGEASDYLRRIKVEVDGELGIGPIGTSIREDRTVINQDFFANPAMGPWRNPAAAFGFRASASLPLRQQGKVIGALGLYALKPGIFDPAQIELLESLSADMTYALDAMQQERALRESERQKDEFLATLSHELRNPLVPISNALFILEHASPGGEQDRHARAVIGRQVSQLTRLVDDLLDVTRISSGKLRLVKRRFDLVDLVRRTAEDHRMVFGQAAIEFALRAGEQPLYVDGDEARIEQVIGNLLSNSAKFTAQGGQVALEVEPVLRDGEAVVRVRDTGVGMSPETLTQLFRPFMQADQALDRSRGGLGLGLAVVKRVVELHGGRVEARSAGVGAGAEFVLWLPAETTAAVPERPKRSSRPPPRRVLVIEDGRDAADTLREVLELGEHQVELATNGSEGIAKAQSFKPEVVLCDIGLPGMDGYEVAKALRRDRSLKATRLVALTGYALPEDEARAREAGFDVHLPKPPSLEDIEAVLAALPDPPEA